MHRCDPRAGAGAVALRGRAAAGPVALGAGALVVLAALLAGLGVLRWGPAGTGTVAVAALVALGTVVVLLRSTVASCSVRRGVLGAVVQVSLAAALRLALT